MWVRIVYIYIYVHIYIYIYKHIYVYIYIICTSQLETGTQEKKGRWKKGALEKKGLWRKRGVGKKGALGKKVHRKKRGREPVIGHCNRRKITSPHIFPVGVDKIECMYVYGHITIHILHTLHLRLTIAAEGK